jgi:hypothetical protein
MAKLEMVERYIDRHHQVGTVYEPGTQFFRGAMPFRWGWLHGDHFADDSPTGGFDVAFFRAEHDGHTVVLVGSRHHVLGERPQKENAEASAFSATPSIMAVIASHVSSLSKTAAWYDLRAVVRKTGILGSSEEDRSAADHQEYGLEAAARIPILYGKPQWMEFLAVPLVEAQLPAPHRADRHGVPQGHGVLATPIYIALTDRKEP